MMAMRMMVGRMMRRLDITADLAGFCPTRFTRRFKLDGGMRNPVLTQFGANSGFERRAGVLGNYVQRGIITITI